MSRLTLLCVASSVLAKTGILSEVRSREFYEKPTTIRKRAKASAVRHAKKLSYAKTHVVSACTNQDHAVSLKDQLKGSAKKPCLPKTSLGWGYPLVDGRNQSV